MSETAPDSPRTDQTGAETPARRFFPVVTAVVLLLDLVTFAVQRAKPALLPALNRDPAALASGEWWRLVTPMFVDPDPVWLVGMKFVGIALIGLVVERELGGLSWLVIYLLGGVAGEMAGFAWDPYSAGFSLPLFALIGALLVLLMLRKRVNLVALLFGLGFIGSQLAQRTGAIWATVLFGVLAGSLGWVLLRKGEWLRRYAPWLGAVGLFVAVILAVFADIHGLPVLIGAGLAAVAAGLKKLGG